MFSVNIYFMVNFYGDVLILTRELLDNNYVFYHAVL